MISIPVRNILIRKTTSDIQMFLLGALAGGISDGGGGGGAP
jgi:hypothetical protein